MKAYIEKLSSVGRTVIDDFTKNPIKMPSEIEIIQVKKFLTHRFKAHHLTLDEAVMHLLNVQTPNQL